MSVSAMPADRAPPVILQTESAECGLACIAMIASAFGHQTDVASLRRRHPVSLKGTTVKTLVKLAGALGMHARPIRADLEHLGNIRAPFIAHWAMNHFIVVWKVSKGFVHLNDPAYGARRMPLGQFANGFTGIALECSPNPDFKLGRETSRVPLTSLMGRVFGLRRGLSALLIASFAIQVCLLAAPLFVQLVVDKAISTGDQGLAVGLAVGFGFLVVLRTLLSALRSWVAARLSADLSLQWLGNVFAHLMKLPLPYFETRHLGDIVSRFASVYSIQRALTVDAVAAVLDGVFAVSALALMGLYSTKLALLAAASLAAYVVVRAVTLPTHREVRAEELIYESRQHSVLIESIRGIQAIRIHDRGELRRSLWLNALMEKFNAQLRNERFKILYGSASASVFGIERVATVGIAAALVMSGSLSLGMLFAYLVYRDEFIVRTTSLVDRILEWRMLRLDGERLSDIVGAPVEHESALIARACDAPPSIEIRDVSFRYAPGEDFVFEGLSLFVRPGECVAITGPSGCGKSTLAKLVLGLVSPERGAILVDGLDLTRFDARNLRASAGVVMQDDQLFSGSIADNISFFDEDADQEKVEAAAKAASIHGEICSMPMGYETLVGDVGTGLSGGQIQRLLLARALYRKPKLLVFDEATSNLDLQNELQINDTLRSLSVTRILIAHRPETIALADRVVQVGRAGIVLETSRLQDGRLETRHVTSIT